MNADIKKMKEDKYIEEVNDEEVESLKDFLRKYYLKDISRQDYFDEKRNRRLFEVKMDPLTDKEATKRMLNGEKQLEYTGTDSGEIKTLNKYIMVFFKALGVDTSIFKEDGRKNGKYKMTKEFKTLLRDILDRREISGRVIKKELDILSTQQTWILFERIKSAIEEAPCSKEQRDVEIERLYRVLVGENLENRNSPLPPNAEFSNLLREIMYTVWEVIMQQGWKPNPEHYISGIYDEHWNTVCEHVADELYERHLLVIKKLEGEGGCFKTIMRLIREEEVEYALFYKNLPQIQIPEGGILIIGRSQEEAKKYKERTCECKKLNII